MKPLLTILLPVLLLVACGEDDPALNHCSDYCENQGTATNCPDEVATDDVVDCKQVCNSVIPQLDASCQATASTFFECSAASDTWECGIGGNVPTRTSDTCDAAADAYAACFAAQ